MHLRSLRVACVTLHDSILPRERLPIVTKSVTKWQISLALRDNANPVIPFFFQNAECTYMTNTTHTAAFKHNIGLQEGSICRRCYVGHTSTSFQGSEYTLT